MSWRHRAAAPLVALIGLAGGGAAYVVSSATSASAVTPVTTESEFRDAWANDADVVLGADINLTCFEKSDPGGSEAVRDLAGEGTLDGQGFTITQTCPETRVLQITGETGHMTISNVTITGGQAVFGTFSGNGGGGIQVTEENGLTVVDSSISGNATCEGGGGIEMDYSGELTIDGSTFANNFADEGGGVANYGDTVSVLNSTFTGNSSVGAAGGIWAEGDLTLVYATVTQNSVGVDVPLNCDQIESTDGHPHAAAVDGADNIEVDGTFHAFGNIVAQPGGGNDNCFIESSDSSGYNFSDDDTCGFDASTDSVSPTNAPNLGPLTNNGGPTPTLLPLTGSPVIDAIPHVNCGDGDALVQTTVLSDQRDFARPEVAGGNCDIGAVEVQAATPTPTPEPAPAAVVQPKFTG
ncbi:MAG TPA: right-handed parallel beta-helix repeat-containing protein [Acidimicrobiia bacterium]